MDNTNLYGIQEKTDAIEKFATEKNLTEPQKLELLSSLKLLGIKKEDGDLTIQIADLFAFMNGDAGLEDGLDAFLAQELENEGITDADLQEIGKRVQADLDANPQEAELIRNILNNK